MKINVPNDSAWLAQRERRWEALWNHCLRVDGVSGAERRGQEVVVSAQKQWYLQGDLAPLLAAYHKITEGHSVAYYLHSVMALCPATDIEVYLKVFCDYSEWCSQEKVDYWAPEQKERDAAFFERFFASFYLKSHIDSSAAIYQHMLTQLLPNEQGLLRFPLQLGCDQWQPCQQFALADLAFKVFLRVSKYLFGDEPGFSHVLVSLPLLQHLHLLSPEYFSTTLVEGSAQLDLPPPAPQWVYKGAQRLTRMVVGMLHGYRDEALDYEYEGPLRHNDPEVEQQVRDIIAAQPMPDEYHQLLEFIKRNPDDFIYRSE